MDDEEFSRRRTQIDDLPPCLMIDILTRLPTKNLLIMKSVCKSWFLSFSDPLFVILHRARSPALILRRPAGVEIKCMKSVGGEDLTFETNVTLPDSKFTCASSCHGLLCLENCSSCDEIYVCNPILGEYITIPIVNRDSLAKVKSVLGFCRRSNQFKVLQINSAKQNPAAYMAEIYTIGNGTLQWKSIGMAPSCPFDCPVDSVDSFLNGSIHWPDTQTRRIVYFHFESERFGSLPSPPAWRDGGRWSRFSELRVDVLDGCLCISAFVGVLGYEILHTMVEKWVMTEYGVEESWTALFTTPRRNFELNPLEPCYFFDYVSKRNSFRRFDCRSATTTYSPSFVSLQDVARSEHLTVLSRTMTNDQHSMEVISNDETENPYEGAGGPDSLIQRLKQRWCRWKMHHGTKQKMKILRKFFFGFGSENAYEEAAGE